MFNLKLVLTALIFGVALSQVQAETEYDYAEVLDARPIVRIVEVSIPQEQCWEEEVLVDRRSNNQSGTPVVLSTIIGGALGNAVGHNKSNKRVGTVVGAVLGHSIGRDIMRSNQGSQGQSVQTVQRCETVMQTHEEERVTGYRVTYLYDGREYTTRTDSDPGDSIQVRVSIQPVL